MHYFIEHTAYDPEDGVAYFGPFDIDDPEDYANDAYADLLAGFGEVDVIDEVAPDIYVNPKTYWDEQRARIEGVLQGPARARMTHPTTDPEQE